MARTKTTVRKKAAQADDSTDEEEWTDKKQTDEEEWTDQKQQELFASSDEEGDDPDEDLNLVELQKKEAAEATAKRTRKQKEAAAKKANQDRTKAAREKKAALKAAKEAKEAKAKEAKRAAKQSRKIQALLQRPTPDSSVEDGKKRTGASAAGGRKKSKFSPDLRLDSPSEDDTLTPTTHSPTDSDDSPLVLNGNPAAKTKAPADDNNKPICLNDIDDDSPVPVQKQKVTAAVKQAKKNETTVAVKQEKKNEKDDDDDSVEYVSPIASPTDSDVAGMLDKPLHVKILPRSTVPKSLIFRSEANRILTAPMALANAIDYCLSFPQSDSAFGGGVIHSRVTSIYRDLQQLQTEFGHLLKPVVDSIDKAIKPAYFLHKIPVAFNVEKQTTPLPVMVVTNPDKVHGFAVFGDLLFRQKEGKKPCAEKLTQKALKELKYFAEEPQKAADGKSKTILSVKPEVVHYAIALNGPWISSIEKNPRSNINHRSRHRGGQGPPRYNLNHSSGFDQRNHHPHSDLRRASDNGFARKSAGGFARKSTGSFQPNQHHSGSFNGQDGQDSGFARKSAGSFNPDHHNSGPFHGQDFQDHDQLDYHQDRYNRKGPFNGRYPPSDGHYPPSDGHYGP